MNNNYARVPSSLLLTLLSILVCLWSTNTLAAAEEVSRYKGTIPEKNTEFPKVSRELLLLQQDYSSYQLQAQTAAKRDPFTPHAKLIRTSGGYVVVDAIAHGDAAALQNDLLGMGAVNVSTHRSVVSARVPITALQSLNNLDSLRFVRPFYATTNIGATDSQGDEAQASDLLRSGSSVDGTGTIVGVLSDSYDCLSGAAAGIATFDLPASVNVLKDEIGCSSGSDEGRGMLEIVHDVAPGAGLAFYTAFLGMADFANGITELRTTGNADVIVDDVFYFAEPMFQDGVIADAAEAAFGNGVPYFSSAGNAASNSYEGIYTDSGISGPLGGQAHDFDRGPGIDPLQELEIAVGAGFTASFQWNQPFASLGGAGATSDLDIFVVGADRETILASSTTNNLAFDAVEIFSYTNTGFWDLDGDTIPDETFYILIEHNDGSKPEHIKYSLTGSGVFIVSYETDSGTSFGHASAAGAESVGAAHYEDTPAFNGGNPPLLEGFSSWGNVPIYFDAANNPITPPLLRLKPEITAPDGANTTFFGSPDSDTPADGFPNFFGTSAAAPHAAGAAALLLQVDGTLTPTEIYSALENTAIDIAPAGYDFGSGFGLIQADDAAAALGNTAPVLDAIAGQAGSTGDAALVFSLNATDADADSIAFSQVGMPSFCALTDIGDGTGNITCTVTALDTGVSSVVVTATDNGSPPQAHSQGFYLIANRNTAPLLTAIGAQAMNDNENLNFAISSSDPDGDVLSLAFPLFPSFCTPTDNGDSTGSVDCNPGFNNTGLWELPVAAVDDGVPNLNDGEAVLLTINNVNRDPVLNLIGPQGIDEGVVSIINASASDPDVPDAISFSSLNEPVFCEGTDNFDGTGFLTCSPTFADAGDYDLTIIVTDSFAGTDSELFTITVNDVNRPPIVDFIGNRAMVNTDVLVIPVSASDPDGNAIALSDSNLPTFCTSPMTDNGDGTGSITCTPGGGNNGTYNNVTVTATDDGTGALTGVETFTLVVGDPGSVNDAPVLGAIGDQAVDDTSQLVIPLSASDADGSDTLAFVAIDLPTRCDALVDNGNGTGSITCNPTFGDEGSYPMSVRVDDNGTPVLSDIEQFTINVSHDNAVPVADAGPDQSVPTSQSVFLDGTASSDAEGGVLSYSWRFVSTAVGSALTDVDLINPLTSTPSFVPDVDGSFVLEVTVTDVDTASDTDTVLIVADTPKSLIFIDGLNNRISVRNTTTGANTGDIPMILAGQTVSGGSGLAVNPINNQMFAALMLNGDDTTRHLVTLDPLTGTATSVGDLGDEVQGLTFDSFGTLYAVTGDPASPCNSNDPGPTTPETLFTVDVNTAVMTFEQTLGNGACGEDIAYNPTNDTIYHSSGAGDQIFETVNLDTDDTTNITYSGDPISAFIVYGLVYDDTQDLFLGTMFNFDSGALEYFSLTPGGVVSTITSPLNVSNFLWKGHAFWDVNFQPSATVKNDHDGDRRSDILWRNSSTGQNWVYLMNGATIGQSLGVNTVVGAAWEIVGNGDYDGDGDADVLWRNSSTGQNWMYLMNGAAIESSAGVNTVASASWNVVGNGDYDGDGNSDILWRNSATGQLWIYLMNGASISSSLGINMGNKTVPDSDSTVVGSGDYDGDGRSDILWRNTATGFNWIYFMNGATIVNAEGINIVSGTAWQIVGSGDHNGDGNADILWRNGSTGQNWMYLMNGATISSSIGVNTVADLNWTVAGSGDYDGDGNADILWRNSSTGQNWVYLMTGATITSSIGVNTVTNTSWEIVSTW